MRETNDWILFNNIVYKIYTVSDRRLMRTRFLEQLNMLIDFDAADFYLADGERGLFDPVLYNTEAVAGELDKLDYSRGILYDGECAAYRESDIMSDSARVETPYYKTLYVPNGWHFSAQMICAYEMHPTGVVTLYRKIGKPDFDHDDIMILDMLKEHMAYRLFRDRNHDGFDISETAAAFAEEFDLTRREKTVLCHILAGEDNAEISEKLCISVHTLKKHILNIYRKADVNSRLKLVNKVKNVKK